MHHIFTLKNIFSEFKNSFRLAIPLIAAEIIYALNNFVATIMIAHLGKEQLAANALVWSIYVALILLFIGILAAVSIMTAQSYGAKDHNGVGICLKQGLILGIIFALPSMLIIRMASTVLLFTHQDPNIIQIAKPFFNSLSWSIFPCYILIVIQQFLTGITKTRLVMLMSILAVPIEIIFYYIFIFGKFGMPKLGLAGIGYGLTTCYTLLTIFFIYYLKKSSPLKIYNLFHKWWKINPQFFWEIIRIGFPMGIMFFSEVGLFAVIAFMMGKLGSTALAAHQIAYQFLIVAIVILFGTNQSVTVRIGNEVNQNNRSILKLITFVNLVIGIIFMLIPSIFYFALPDLVIGIDLKTSMDVQPIINQAKILLSIISIFVLADCLRLIMVGALRGLKDTSFSLYFSVLGFWGITFPFSYLLAFKFHLGAAGIWWGMVLGFFIVGIIYTIRFEYLVNNIDLEKLVTKS